MSGSSQGSYGSDYWNQTIYDCNQSDYSSEGASSNGSNSYWGANNGYASTDSGRSMSSMSSDSGSSYHSSGSGTSWGSASTWGWSSANQSDYDADTESLASNK